MSGSGDENGPRSGVWTKVPSHDGSGATRARSEPGGDSRKKVAHNTTISTLSEETEAESVPLQDSGKTAKFEVSMSPAESAEWELAPPDGGWGWLVLAGSMLVNILVPGTVKSFGVLFVEFLEVFDATPAAAAWIPALCYFLYSSLGPLSSILSVKYSYRTVTVLGGTFAAMGMILSFWASSVTYLYFSYGVLVGTGAGLSFPPTVYIVTSYFVRLRGLANGLCISGSALGSIILPPILRLLLETYGYRGAVLIMGAVTLNVWVGAIFYHPVERHMKRVLKTDSHSDSGDEKLVLPEKEPDSKFSVDNEKLLSDVKVVPSFVRSASSAAVQNFASPVLERTRKISMPMQKEMHNSQMHSAPALHAVPEARYSSLDYFSQSHLPASRLAKVRPPVRSPSTSSFNYVSTPYHGSTLSALHPQQFASSLTLKSITFSPSKLKATAHQEPTKPVQRNQYFDITLLKDPMYLIILISNSTNAISYTNFIILLPSYAIVLGFDKTMAAYLISIVSALDLVGRIGGSALSDLGLIPKQWYFIGGLLISGIALTLLPTTNTYGMICMYCGVFGLASGIYVGVTAIIMADMLGEERLTSTYGISLFVNGILQLIGPPLCGLWYDLLGTYSTLFNLLGIILVVGASIWGFVPFLRKKTKGSSC